MDEAQSISTSFMAMVERNFNTKIKEVQSNGGKKFYFFQNLV